MTTDQELGPLITAAKWAALDLAEYAATHETELTPLKRHAIKSAIFSLGLVLERAGETEA